MAFLAAKTIRPVLHLPRTAFEIMIEILAPFLLFYMAWSLISAWSSLPATVPAHFDAAGQIDAWTHKNPLFFPVTPAAFLYILLTAISFFPHIYNYPVAITAENAERQYRTARTLITVIKGEIMLPFTYIQWTVLHAASAILVPGFILMIFGTVAYFIYQAYRLR